MASIFQICGLEDRDAGGAASGEPQSGPRGNATYKSRRCCCWRLGDRRQEKAVPFVTRSPGSLRKEGYKCSGPSGTAFREAGHQQPATGREEMLSGWTRMLHQPVGQLKARLGKLRQGCC